MAQLARLARFCQDLGMSVKCNKNELCDYLTTGPVKLVVVNLYLTRVILSEYLKVYVINRSPNLTNIQIR